MKSRFSIVRALAASGLARMLAGFATSLLFAAPCSAQLLPYGLYGIDWNVSAIDRLDPKSPDPSDAVLTACGADCSRSATDVSSRRVRSTDATILRLIAEGEARSDTFRALTDFINRSKDIVYVEYGNCRFGRLNGCLLPPMVSPGGERYLFVLVTADNSRVSHDQRLAIIAHELQHIIEVIEHPDVVDIATMERMFRKIGVPLRDGLTGYETSAARSAGDRSFTELMAQRTAALAASGALSSLRSRRPR